ncbi:GNAT family N-acetyltransferase [Flavivirga sp. 57AJ16]|uniref:GNAT family N-acetyltransferase n=1 Tax=Flavivirga sp. 57AJ16 TaxID=3025307 RepID=UPI0023670EB8|nr:GNAT family N-acetyltransferase [Flavivirga sp. 57AJ16]MDD7885843.1 GNAT family N-acetyltransferase [Flavivirga sp. 57AJ16]
MSFLKKENFFLTIIEKNLILNYYKSLQYAFNKKHTVYNAPESTSPVIENNHVASLIAFPQFLYPTFIDQNLIRAKKITQRKQESFGIIIDKKYKSTDDHLRAHFSKSSRTPIIKKMKRLESCFDIGYKMFFGEMTHEEYDFIMDCSHKMILKRFELLNETNFFLKKWDTYYKSILPLLRLKKASILVIYDGDTPIQISINFHFNKMFFAVIPAFDVDYSKFGLGNIAIYKQLDWCIKNDYDYLDMGNGDLEYKVRWCNHSYNLETHVLYRKKSVLPYLIASLEITKIRIKNILKTLHVDDHLKRLKLALNKNKRISKNTTQLNYTLKEIKKIPKDIDFPTINVNAPIFKNFKKPLYDYLFAHRENINDIVLLKINSSSFLVKGKNSLHELSINN